MLTFQNYLASGGDDISGASRRRAKLRSMTGDAYNRSKCLDCGGGYPPDKYKHTGSTRYRMSPDRKFGAVQFFLQGQPDVPPGTG